MQKHPTVTFGYNIEQKIKPNRAQRRAIAQWQRREMRRLRRIAIARAEKQLKKAAA